MKSISFVVMLTAFTTSTLAQKAETEIEQTASGAGAIRRAASIQTASNSKPPSVLHPLHPKKNKRQLKPHHHGMRNRALIRHLKKSNPNTNEVADAKMGVETNFNADANTEPGATLNGATAAQEEKDRGLKKAKSGKSMGGGHDDGWWGGGGRGDGKLGGKWRDDDRSIWDDDMRDDDRFFNDDRLPDGSLWRDDDRWNSGGRDINPRWGGSGKSGKNGGYFDDDWDGGIGGKSGKSDGWSGDYDFGSGKSGKGGSGDYWGDDDGYYGGKSGKSGGFGDWCEVTITNLSFEQAFSEMFVMVHNKAVTKILPIYTFGESANAALSDLADSSDTSTLMSRYQGRRGVKNTWVISKFGNFGVGIEDKYLAGGGTRTFRIRPSSDYDRLSIATGLPFSNDGVVVLHGKRIYDGAEYMLPALDAGVEANIQTCWSVPAKQNDFPPNSDCYDDNDADENDNTFGGENFVHIHRGMQDLDGRNELDNILPLTCQDADLDNSDDDTRFAVYFLEEGYDDDLLLCRAVAGNNCDLRSDDDFLDFVNSADDDMYREDFLIAVARNSDDFDDFCDRIKDINDDLKNAFTTLEPAIFDWRNSIAQVEIDCY